MSLVDDVLADLGLSYDGLSLNQVKQAASAVDTGPLEQMATVFESGHQVLAAHHGELEKAVDTAVSGWKGKAAQAASTRVLSTAFQSRDAGYAAQSSASAVRQFVSTVKTQKQNISTVAPVDTSFHAALSKAGGPAAILLSPTAIVTNMAASQHQSVQHQKQAVGYLKSMNDAGTQLASEQQDAFPTPPPTTDGQRSGRALPASLTVPEVSDPGNTRSANQGYQPPPGSGYVAPAGSGGAPKSTHHLSPAPGGGGTTGTTGGSGPGSGSGGGHPPVLGPPQNGGGATPPQSGAPGSSPAGSPASPPPAALPSGALPGAPSTVAISAGALAGGGALLAAGRLSGAGRAALGGAGVRGFRGAGLEDGSVARLGSGGTGGVSGPEGPGTGVGRGLGAGETSAGALRAGSISPSAAGELAAGEGGGRGMYPGGMGGSRGGGGDEELDKRPDYLVETDDIWGDGRLAAPPVLG